MSLSVLVETEPCTAPAHLSPSSISTWQQCPLRYKLSKIDKIPEPSTDAQLLGSFTHEILEYLYQLPHEERTLAAARRLSASLWNETWAAEVAELNLDEEAVRRFRWQTWWCIEAMFKIEDPALVTLGATEQRLETYLGDVKLLGILDRWHPLDDGRAVISDYKTGKKPKPRYEGEKKFQLGVYVHLVRAALGLDVAYTELLYLKEGIRWKFEPTDKYVDEVVETVQQVAVEIKDACAAGSFEAKPAILCDWCNFKSTCPAWK